ncbi:conserved hypothetical protein [delta proteobacterium NaphS2]|nr:conserved hypothetical protein [delta proteobacterium NaphS2]
MKLLESVYVMTTHKGARRSIIERPFTGKLSGLERIGFSADHKPQRIATLSFPVREYRPTSDNTSLIVEIVEKRHPALLLCAGWSVPTEQSLGPIIAATQYVKTSVVLETTSPTPIYFRITNGCRSRMGAQFFSTREDTNNAAKCGPDHLANALSDRSFPFLNREVLLLICGEVMVVRGRKKVQFHWSVPQVLQDAVRAPSVMILNPTHTRMGNCGTVKAWREYLSSGGRTYVSASNWDLSSGQHRSDTLHSVWYNGNLKTPVYSFENEQLCYRECLQPV